MKKQFYFNSTELFSAVLILALIGGWIANIVKLINSDFANMSGLIVMRVIGVFIAPIGAVLGFV